MLTSLRRSPGTKANTSKDSFCEFKTEKDRFGKLSDWETNNPSLQFIGVSSNKVWPFDQTFSHASVTTGENGRSYSPFL